MPAPIMASIRLSDPALLDWLADVLELTVAERTPTPDGAGLAHAQLWLGDACVMCSTAGQLDAPVGAASIYLAFSEEADVRRRYDRAIADGATSVMAPTPMDYGGINATIRDRDGNHWSLGTYRPVAP